MIYVSIISVKPRSIDKEDKITKSLNEQFEEYINILVEKRKSESINIDNINEEIEQLEKRLDKVESDIKDINLDINDIDNMIRNFESEIE